jgi:hypothetical protein
MEVPMLSAFRTAGHLLLAPRQKPSLPLETCAQILGSSPRMTKERLDNGSPTQPLHRLKRLVGEPSHHKLFILGLDPRVQARTEGHSFTHLNGLAACREESRVSGWTTRRRKDTHP